MAVDIIKNLEQLQTETLKTKKVIVKIKEMLWLLIKAYGYFNIIYWKVTLKEINIVSFIERK